MSPKYLNKLRENKKKGKEIEYVELKMQNYLQPNTTDITNKEAKLLFQIRSRMLNIKMNMKSKYKDNLKCEICEKEDESQEHMLECTELVKGNDIIMYIPEYGEIFEEDIDDQLYVSRLINQNMKIRQVIINERISTGNKFTQHQEVLPCDDGM